MAFMINVLSRFAQRSLSQVADMSENPTVSGRRAGGAKDPPQPKQLYAKFSEPRTSFF